MELFPFNQSAGNIFLTAGPSPCFPVKVDANAVFPVQGNSTHILFGRQIDGFSRNALSCGLTWSLSPVQLPPDFSTGKLLGGTKVTPDLQLFTGA